ncbi:MAG: alpha/beta hydrolase [Anaerolineales bacterium]|nr:alpha/beta hydrolase [Anaerolineales bacterium]
MTQVVEFSSLGVTLRGHLYLPKNTDHKVPIVIMAHGFSATISGMVADRYAESFQAAGFAVLLYDHYSLGISDGEPRQHINAWVRPADILTLLIL